MTPISPLSSFIGINRVEDMYKKDVMIEDHKVRLCIVDTAGQEELVHMKDIYVDKGDAFILVYSIDDSNSFQQLRNFCDLILRKRSFDEVPVIVVGNKSDMVDMRMVSTAEGEAFAKSIGKEFIETSALTGQNVQKTFSILGKRLLTRFGVSDLK